MLITKFQFIGIGNFGINILESLKKDILKIKIKGLNLYDNSENNLLYNPFSFLCITESNSFEKEPYLFKKSEIISLSNRDLSNIVFKKIKELANLTYLNNNEIEINTDFLPIVYFFDIFTFRKEKDKIRSLLSRKFDNDLLNSKYLFLNVKRNRCNGKLVDELAEFFNSIFLLGEDSSIFVINEEINRQIILNFISSVIQSSNFNLLKYFNPNYDRKIFIIGATKLELNKELLFQEFTNKVIFEDDKLNENILNKIRGEFRKIEPEEKKIFSLEEFKTNDELKIYNEEYFPTITPNIINISTKISNETQQWINYHLQNLKAIFQIEVFLNKTNELFNIDIFYSTPIEDWKLNLDAIDFFLKKDIIQEAKSKAEATKKDSKEKWENDYFKNNLLNELFSKNFTTIVCNRGIIVFDYTKRMISFLKEKLRKNNLKETKRNNLKETITRKELDAKINNLPHKNSIVTRILIIFIVFIYIFNMSVSSNFISKLNGLIIFIPLFFVVSYSIWFLNYKKKVDTLKESLYVYLQYQMNKAKEKIQKIEKDLIDEFLLSILYKIYESFVPRENFFYYTFKQRIISFEELCKKDIEYSKKKPNILEKYFINFFNFLDGLKKNNPNIINSKKSHLDYYIPLSNEEIISTMIDNINKNFQIEFLCNEEKYLNLSEKFFKTLLPKNELQEIGCKIITLLNFEIRKILNNTYQDIKEFFEKHNDYQIDDKIIYKMIDNLKPTFWKNRNMNFVFNNNFYIFTPIVINEFNNILFQQNIFQIISSEKIVFCYLEEIEFDKIIWE